MVVRVHESSARECPRRVATACMQFGASCFLAALFVTVSATALAAPGLRVQVQQHGNFLIVGNTLGQDCRPPVPRPVIGTLGSCGSWVADTGQDVYWRSDHPFEGEAYAATTVPNSLARSTAWLELPEGSVVTHAYLYWTGNSVPGDSLVSLGRTGADGFEVQIQAVRVFPPMGPLPPFISADPAAINETYLSVADIGSLVATHGSGGYRLSGAAGEYLFDLNSSNVFSSWWMIVLYERDEEPLRSLAIHDGLDAVNYPAPFDVMLAGFEVPAANVNAELALVAIDGDNVIVGDSVSLDGNVLANATNPANDFFNGTHSRHGVPVSTPGDLPQTTGAPGSLSGLDIDVLDVSAQVTPGASQLTLSPRTTELVFLTGVVFSINSPIAGLRDSSLAVEDINGGALLPGDLLQYTLTVVNGGSGAVDNVIVEGALPIGTSLSPDSLEITSGPNAGTFTDAPGDDAAEYQSVSREVVFRVGEGADANAGGMLEAGAVSVLRFKVVVDASACTLHETFSMQASVRGTDIAGGGEVHALTDGDVTTIGQQPTSTSIDVECLTLELASPPAHGFVSTDLSGFACEGGNCSTSVPTGLVVHLDAIPDAGYGVTGWSGDCAASTGEPEASVLMDAPKACAVSFAGLPHVLGVVAQGVSGSGLLLALDDEQVLEIPGNGSYAFALPIATGDPYAVTIAAQPSMPPQTCSFEGDQPPIGTMPNADVLLSLSCRLDVDLAVAITDEREFADVGQVVDYVLTLHNSGVGTAWNLSVRSTLSSAFDATTTTWECLGGDVAGSECAPDGIGEIDDHVDLPSSATMIWYVRASIRADASEATARLGIEVSGHIGIGDDDVLVLFRDGYEEGAPENPAPAGSDVDAGVSFELGAGS